MINKKHFTTRERIACTILSYLKYDEEWFIPCRFNDFLLNASKYIIGVDPGALFEKVANEVKSAANT